VGSGTATLTVSALNLNPTTTLTAYQGPGSSLWVRLQEPSLNIDAVMQGSVSPDGHTLSIQIPLNLAEPVPGALTSVNSFSLELGPRSVQSDSCPGRWSFEAQISAVEGASRSATTSVACTQGPPQPPPDQDQDGIPDERDACPTQPGVAPDGCPQATIPPPPQQQQPTVQSIPPAKTTPPPVALARGRATFRGRVRLRGRLLLVGLRCPAKTTGCLGRLIATYKARGRRLTAGTKTVSLAPNSTRTFRVTLNSRVLHELRNHGIRVTITLQPPPVTTVQLTIPRRSGKASASA
jgi:hypothetical protein